MKRPVHAHTYVNGICMQALGVALVQRGNMGGRTQLSETGQSLLAFCDKTLAVCAEAAQVSCLWT